MKNIISKQILQIAKDNKVLLTRDFKDDLDRIENKIDLYKLLIKKFTTKDGKILNTGDTFYSISSDVKMTSSGYQKVVPIELIFPNDWHLSYNGSIAYFSKKECLKECKKRNILLKNK